MYINKIRKIIKEMERIHKVYPNYIHFDFALSDPTKPGCVHEEKYNIYTPQISHNTFFDFKDFLAFIKSLTGDDNILRIKKLKKDLKIERSNRNRANDAMRSIKSELKNIDSSGNKKREIKWKK